MHDENEMDDMINHKALKKLGRGFNKDKEEEMSVDS
jgi:hypothetical protein